ncbi:MAG: alpha/beta fold hydrolase [Pirellulales bacterium]
MRFLPIVLAMLILALESGADAVESTGPGPDKLTLAPYVFQTPDGRKLDAELGRLVVPENRTKTDSRSIELVFVRFKSTAEKPGPPIVYLAGGPGGSGIELARGARFPVFDAMREVGDVIALDQRGAGRCMPKLACQDRWNFPLDQPGDPAVFLRLALDRCRECAEHWKRQGVDLNGYNTNESADDLEDLRRALGVEKISLLAASYGTHLALATIRRHESSIHRAVLAGVEGPDHTLKLPSAGQTILEKIDRLVKADLELSQRIPDLLGLMRRVLERLDRQPVTVEVTDPQTREKVKVAVGKFDLQFITAQSLGSRQAMRMLPALYEAMSNGDFSFLARTSIEVRRSPIGSAMAFMMDCASGASPERLAQIQREARQCLLGNAANFPMPEIRGAWGNPDLGPAFRAAVHSTLPVLFVSGTLDGRTPASNADEVQAGFPNSVQLVIDGAAHGDDLFVSSPTIKNVMVEFMKGHQLPATSIAIPPLRFSPLSRRGD